MTRFLRRRINTRPRNQEADTICLQNLPSAKRTVSRGAVQAYGKSIHRRSFQLITRAVFISGSAPPPPGMCVTVNAHSPEHCGTLSLSMTDITHGRTSRWLLWIPYGNVAWPISRAVHLWNYCSRGNPVLSQPAVNTVTLDLDWRKKKGRSRNLVILSFVVDDCTGILKM